MNRTKYRLLGVVIIVLLILIFAPSFFKHMNQRQTKRNGINQTVAQSMPVAESVTKASMQQALSQATAPAAISKKVATQSTAKTNTVAPAIKTVSAKPAEKMPAVASSALQYSVQVASYRSQEFAKDFADKLSAKSLPAYVHHKDGTRYTAVFVGPFADKNSAQLALKAINKEYHAHGVVRHYHNPKA